MWEIWIWVLYCNYSKKLLNQDFDCNDVLNLDEGIRFVGVCSKNGIPLDYVYRDEINPLLSTDDLKLSIQNTVLKHNIRHNEVDKIGEPIYSVTFYENVKRATITLDEKLLLLVSFESKKDEHQMMQKILNYIRTTVKNKKHYELN